MGAAGTATQSERAPCSPCPAPDCGTAPSARLQPEDDPGSHPRGRHGAAEWIAQMPKKSRDCAAAAAASSTPPLAHLFRPPGVSTTARRAMTRPRQARRGRYGRPRPGHGGTTTLDAGSEPQGAARGERREAQRANVLKGRIEGQQKRQRPSVRTSVRRSNDSPSSEAALIRFTQFRSRESTLKPSLKISARRVRSVLRTAIQGSPLPTPEHPAATEHSTQWENLPGLRPATSCLLDDPRTPKRFLTPFSPCARGARRSARPSGVQAAR